MKLIIPTVGLRVASPYSHHTATENSFLKSYGSALPPDVRRRLRPADSSQITQGYAPGPLRPSGFNWAKGRTDNVKGTSTAGHSHRRTSGGKAEATSTKDF